MYFDFYNGLPEEILTAHPMLSHQPSLYLMQSPVIKPIES